MINLSTVIVNWNQARLTIDTLNSILDSKFRFEINHSIFVVDNGSSTKEVDVLQTYIQQHSNLHLIKLNTNTGFCHGYNQGIQKALQNNPDYITIANNDIRLKTDTIEKLISFLQKKTIYSAVSPLIYFEKGYEYQKNRYNKKQLGHVIWAAGGNIDWKNIYGSNNLIDKVDTDNLPKIIQKIDLLSGCFAIFRGNAIEQIGGFDEKYYLYYEDADLFTRLRQKKLKFACYTPAKLWHLNSASSSAGSALHDYFLTRNRLIFGFQYASIRTRAALLKQALIQYFKPRNNWEKQAIHDFFTKKFGKGSWNVT